MGTIVVQGIGEESGKTFELKTDENGYLITRDVGGGSISDSTRIKGEILGAPGTYHYLETDASGKLYVRDTDVLARLNSNTTQIVIRGEQDGVPGSYVSVKVDADGRVMVAPQASILIKGEELGAPGTTHTLATQEDGVLLVEQTNNPPAEVAKDPSNALAFLKVDANGYLLTADTTSDAVRIKDASDNEATVDATTGALKVYQTNSTDSKPALLPDCTTKDYLHLNSAGELKVSGSKSNAVDSNNSTTTPLAAAGVFTGASTDLLNYSSVSYSVFADVNSATDGIELQFSPDGTNWDTRVKNTYTYDGIVQDLHVRAHDRYFRIKYTNGATLQATFRLHTILNANNVQGDSCGVDHPPRSGDDAILVKSIMSGYSTAGGSYVDVGVNASGELKIAPTTIAQTPAVAPAYLKVDSNGYLLTADQSAGSVATTVKINGSGRFATDQNVSVSNDNLKNTYYGFHVLPAMTYTGGTYIPTSLSADNDGALRVNLVTPTELNVKSVGGVAIRGGNLYPTLMGRLMPS
jgi:hypothetical protein